MFEKMKERMEEIEKRATGFKGFFLPSFKKKGMERNVAILEG